MVVDEEFSRLEGRTIEGRFSLDRVVARGGSGVVFRGTHLALGCPIAIKMLVIPERERHVSLRRFAEAFEREARIVATLRHPAVVRVIDSGVTEVTGEPHPFVVFEWIEGETLEAHLRGRAGERRSPREALALLRPVLEGIACAHESGVVHRDLKPSNVMLPASGHDATGARVLDFGIAKAARPDAAPSGRGEFTTDEFSSFTLSHAAPEQVGRLRTGAWTDVHALALLAVELLVGERAYRGADTVELFARITSRERPTPRSFGVDVGPWEATLDRALSLDPRERHADAGALLRALEADLDAAERARELPAAPAPAPAPTARRRAAAVSLAALAACAAFVAWRAAPSDDRPRPSMLPLAVTPRAPPAPPADPPAVEAPAAPAPPVARTETAPAPARRLGAGRAAPRPAVARSAARPLLDDRELAIE